MARNISFCIQNASALWLNWRVKEKIPLAPGNPAGVQPFIMRVLR
jgi:hypothetical protein